MQPADIVNTMHRKCLAVVMHFRPYVHSVLCCEEAHPSAGASSACAYSALLVMAYGIRSNKTSVHSQFWELILRPSAVLALPIPGAQASTGGRRTERDKYHKRNAWDYILLCRQQRARRLGQKHPCVEQS